MAYSGNSIVNYLKSVGQDSSFGSRVKLAAQYGISNYSGTASQNLQLLGILKGGNPPAQNNAAPASQTPVQTPSAPATSPLEQVNKMISDSFTKLNSEAISKFGTYQKNNPFALDQILAEKTKQAAEQIDPYYNETITNYLTGVNNKIQRSKQDAQSVLEELNTQSLNFTNRTGVNLARAVEAAKQGFADAGLLSSGAALGTTGETTVDSSNSLSDYLRGNANQVKSTTQGLDRTLTDIGLGKTQDVRNIERNRYTDVSTRANQLAKEAGQSYVMGFQQTLPPELQATTGFDLLKSLGIYS